MRRAAHAWRAAVAVGALTAGMVAVAAAEWMQTEPSVREALSQLRQATRDTTFGVTAARLDTLGVALLRLGRKEDARRMFERVLALAPGDDAAEAGLGKLALHGDRLDDAERLLAAAGDTEGATADLYAARLRRGAWREAIPLAEAVGDGGRVALLERLASEEPYRLAPGPERGRVLFERRFPVPLVKLKLNGHIETFVIDTGVSDLIVDASAARRCGVAVVPGQRTVFWNGTRAVVVNGWTSRLEVAGFRLEGVPTGVMKLARYSLEANPQAPTIGGVIGINVLRRFGVTLDFRDDKLELRRPGVALPPAPDAVRVPFEWWGEGEMTVWGSIAGSRRMAMTIVTGVPACGLAAPDAVFEEIGVRPGAMSKLAKGASRFLAGSRWTQVSAPAVSVGPIAADRVVAWSGALEGPEQWRHGVRRDALLCGDFFRDMRVTFDWEKRELVVETGR